MFAVYFFFFKQKTAYEMRISDWSSDVCSSDLMMESGMLTATGVNTDMSKMDHSKMGHGSHSMKHDDPNSVLVEPGKTKELVWKFTRAADQIGRASCRERVCQYV